VQAVKRLGLCQQKLCYSGWRGAVGGGNQLTTKNEEGGGHKKNGGKGIKYFSDRRRW